VKAALALPGIDDRDEGLEHESCLTAVDVVSPELALVDPELRRADIARLARQDAPLGLTGSLSLLTGAFAAPPSTLDAGLRRIDFAGSAARPILRPATVAAPLPVATRSWLRRIAQLGLLAGLLASGIMSRSSRRVMELPTGLCS
jgi:hypothetical protein